MQQRQCQFAIVSDLPRCESMHTAAGKPHRTLHLGRRGLVPGELEHRTDSIAGERAEEGAERGIVLGGEE